MHPKTTAWATLLVLTSVVSTASERLVLFEFFVRPGCGNCETASETVTELQHELEGRAVLLTYHVDFFGGEGGRVDRFLTSEPDAAYLPLAMVGSGYRTSSSVVDFDSVYREMIDDELARPPRSAVSAHWRRTGDSMRVYLVIENTGDEYLEVNLEAAAWVVPYISPPPANVGLTDTWAQAVVEWPLPYDLGPGESIAAEVETPAMEDTQWNRMHAIVFVEDRTGGGGVYDMAQATLARPAALEATPSTVITGRGAWTTEVELDGPHVLSWTASSDVGWIEATPDTGGVPATVTLTIDDEGRPAHETSGTVTISATGDGMDFTETVTVSVGSNYRRAGRRLSPVRTNRVIVTDRIR